MGGLFGTDADRSGLALGGLRIVVSGLIAAHGWARFLSDAVTPFGDWLGDQGFPLGLGIAIAITALEIGGSIVYALGRLTVPLSLAFASVYVSGIVLVHAAEGWFVVGLGRNGMEYSVLLVCCLLAIGLAASGRAREPGA